MPACMPSFTNGHAQPGARGGVPEVAGQRQAQPGADRRPVDRGDGGHLEAPDREPGPVERASSGCAGGRRVASGSLAIHEVLPPEQKAEPSPVTTTARTRAVGGELVDGRDPGRGHLVGHRVALVGVVEGEQRRRPSRGALEAQVGEVGGVSGMGTTY